MSEKQQDLGLFRVAEADPNVPYLISVLQERDWTTAHQIIEIVHERTGVKWNDRKVRALAAASKGHVLGGQEGYKLNGAVTSDEYQHWRNAMMSQTEEMQKRIVEADLIFYGRKSVAA